MSDYGFPWFEVISLGASLLIPGAGALAGVWWRLQGQITACQSALADYKLVVAEKYATNASLLEFTQAINRLSDRIDTFIDNRNRN